MPFGNVDDVIKATKHLLAMGTDGGYIFAPARAVEGDVPVENMVTFTDTVKKQL